MTEDRIEVFSEDEFIPISALQHMLYCPRQCALIHIERRWAENSFTAEGRILHNRSDAGDRETRGTVRIERSVSLCSFQLGVAGVADVVEIRNDNQFYPIEYKRGRPKSHRADEVQLCAQAICLEEMLNTTVMEGSLFYGRSRRRTIVIFDIELRTLTEQIATDTRHMLTAGKTPDPIYSKRKCEACSLKDDCQPQAPRRMIVERWLASAIEN